MKKLILIFATLGLMFNVIGCKAKKAYDDTEIIENADVEKIDAENATFAGEESITSGPVDESLQAALGETPSVDTTTTTAATDVATINQPSNTTDLVSTEISTPEAGTVETPVVNELTIAATETPAPEIAKNDLIDSGITETPMIETPTITETPTDASMLAETTITGGVEEIKNPVSEITETAITETPIIDTASNLAVEKSAVEKAAKAEVVSSSETTTTTTSSKNKLLKLTDSVPYQLAEGFVNTVYVSRPKEKLLQISQSIYGSDKTKELKSINSFLKDRSPRAGEKIYYISPNRPTDSTRTISFYEDTGMSPSSYTSEKGENLAKISKKLLGYDNAWKEIWTTNSIESKVKLAKGETIRYWKGVDQISIPTTLANLDGKSKLIDSATQMPAQVVTQNLPPPEISANPPQAATQDLPPPPPMPEATTDINSQAANLNQPPAGSQDLAANNMQQELPPPPSAELTPPPLPPTEEIAAAPVAPKQKMAPNMEEETTTESGGLSSDTTTMLGLVALLVAALGYVIVRKNKKKKESDMSSIEQNHVGT